MMVEKKVIVTLEHGLHARPATQFIKASSSFESDITISKGERKVVAKSIMGIMSLAVTRGDEVLITANGSDEEEAIRTLEIVLTEG